MNNKTEIFNVKILSFNKYSGYPKSFIGSTTKAYKNEDGIYVYCYFGSNSVLSINNGFRHVEDYEVEILENN